MACTVEIDLDKSLFNIFTQIFMAHDIFISYSSHDAESAFEVCNIIENYNFECWIAPRNITPGKSYAAEIVKGIHECAIVVLVLSEYSLQSEHVLNEIDIAVRSGKIVLPYVITGLNINDSAYSQLTSPIILIDRIMANKGLFIEKPMLSITTDFNAIVNINNRICRELCQDETITVALANRENVVVVRSADQKYEVHYYFNGDKKDNTLDIKFKKFKLESQLLQEQVKQEIIRKYNVSVEEFTFNQGITCVHLDGDNIVKIFNLHLDVIAELTSSYTFDIIHSDGVILAQLQAINNFDSNNYGYLTIDGKPLIPFRFSKAEPFLNGLAAVSVDGRLWGFIDKRGGFVVPPIYDECYSFNEGRAVAKRGKRFSILDINGKCIIDKPFKECCKSYCNDLLGVRNGKKWGFIDRCGNFAIPAEYDHAKSFRVGLAPVKKNGKWGYIDTNNTVIIDFQFDYANCFSEETEVAIVEQSKMGIIDINGNYILPPEFDNIINEEGYGLMSNALLEKDGLFGLYSFRKSKYIYPRYKEFENFFHVFNNSLATTCTHDNKWVIITNDLDEILLDLQIEYVKPFYFGEDVTVYKKGEMWGIINSKGDLLTDALYDTIYITRYSLLEVKRSGKWGAIDRNGVEIIPCVFDMLGVGGDGELLHARITSFRGDETFKIDRYCTLINYSRKVTNRFEIVIDKIKYLYLKYTKQEISYAEYFREANEVVENM